MMAFGASSKIWASGSSLGTVSHCSKPHYRVKNVKYSSTTASISFSSQLDKKSDHPLKVPPIKSSSYFQSNKFTYKKMIVCNQSSITHNSLSSKASMLLHVNWNLKCLDLKPSKKFSKTKNVWGKDLDCCCCEEFLKYLIDGVFHR